MRLTLADDVMFALLAGIVIAAHAMGRSVVLRDHTLSYKVATFWIFFSGMWFIGPFTYFFFRKKHPLLARRCFQQLLLVTAVFVLMGLSDRYLRSFPGSILPPQPSPFDSHR